ncbi:MAG: UDP-N-acetylmuramate--L-alanine ligase [Planctomycetes bacterium]|nr:UDP-N-acetylmuramate--L-alanine ligase [Planctomycetota bacterium]
MTTRGITTRSVRQIELVAARPVHFVGIGGIGMSGLARILLDSGQRVSGSDIDLSPVARALADRGAVLFQGNRPEHVPADGRAVVITAAVREDNPEVVEARRRGIPVLKYAQMAGEYARGRDLVAVAGTHGKSTTTGLVSFLLSAAGFDPSFLVGAVVRQFGSNAWVGRGRHFVLEACEYDRSFLNYRPSIAVVTNVEADHLDYYRDLEEIRDAFRAFASRVRPGGHLVAHSSVAGLFREVPGVKASLTTYGLEAGSDWRPRAVRLEGRTGAFRLEYRGRDLGLFRTGIPGLHNVLNASGAIAACVRAGARLELLRKWLPAYVGVARRFHVLHETPELAVVDDYAHHPTEIGTVIRAARKAFAGRRLWVVFQPHQHSRTRHLLDEFAASFGDVDRVIVTDIYGARDSEEDRRSVHARDLVGRILARDGRAYYVSGFDAVLAHLEENLERGDVVLCLGAGTIDRFARELVVLATRRRSPEADR